MDEGLDPRLLRALNHPLRIEILRLLEERESASPNQLANITRTSLGVVSYHVRRLDSLGFIELARRKQRRGAIEHFYRLRDQSRSGGNAVELDHAVRRAGLRARVRELTHELGAAGMPARFERPEAAIHARRLVLDHVGRDQLAQALAEMSARAKEISKESDARRSARRRSETDQAAGLILMLFDAPAE